VLADRLARRDHVRMPEFSDRIACVSSAWTPESHLHSGNLQWAAAGGDGSPPPTLTLTWGQPLVGFADAWIEHNRADVTLFLSPEASTQEAAQAVADIAGLAVEVSVPVAVQESGLVHQLTMAGFTAKAGEPWFVQLWRSLADLSDLDQHVVPPGYAIRATRPEELAERVSVHRRCWAPARISELLGMPVTEDENESRYTITKHEAVVASPLYRPELDLVAEDPAGELVAYGIGWLDPRSESVLFEPIGTDPRHGGKGLARALCAEILRRAASLGATQAVVGPRGDAAYSLPRRVYEGLGMQEVARFVTYTRSA
jgi:ribosomal protein S18 acetylase RimI-like enzyme